MVVPARASITASTVGPRAKRRKSRRGVQGAPRGGARRFQTREDADERGGGGGCGHSHGAMKLAGAARRPGSDPVDIEDLVAPAGRRAGVRISGRETHERDSGAHLLPVQLPLDPSVRAAMDVDVKGALVILDEAHNVEDVAREAASCDVALSDVAAAAEEFRRVPASFDDENRENHRECSNPNDSNPNDSNPVGNALLASVLEGVARWLGGASDLSHPRCPLRADGFERWMAVWSDGARVARQMRDMGLDPARLASMEDARKAAVKEANDSKTPPSRRVGGAALKTAEMLFTSARYARGGVGAGGASAISDCRAANVGGVGRGRFRRRRRTIGDDDALSVGAQPGVGVRGSRGSGRGARGRAHLRDARPAELVRVRVGRAFSDSHGGAALRGHAHAGVGRGGGDRTGGARNSTGRSRPPRSSRTRTISAPRSRLGARTCRTACWCSSSYSMLDRVAKRWRTTGLWKRLEQNTGKRIFSGTARKRSVARRERAWRARRRQRTRRRARTRRRRGRARKRARRVAEQILPRDPSRAWRRRPSARRRASRLGVARRRAPRRVPR